MGAEKVGESREVTIEDFRRSAKRAIELEIAAALLKKARRELQISLALFVATIAVYGLWIFGVVS